MTQSIIKVRETLNTENFSIDVSFSYIFEFSIVGVNQLFRTYKNNPSFFQQLYIMIPSINISRSDTTVTDEKSQNFIS